MRQRIWLALVGGGILSFVALTVAQRFQPSGSPDSGSRVSVHADNSHSSGGQVTFAGNVSITVNGVTISADRAIIQNGEYQLSGNVRMKAETPPAP